VLGLTEKLGDIKLKKHAGDCLVAFAENTSLQFVLTQGKIQGASVQQHNMRSLFTNHIFSISHVAKAKVSKGAGRFVNVASRGYYGIRYQRPTNQRCH
jgi:hypothetical protein